MAISQTMQEIVKLLNIYGVTKYGAFMTCVIVRDAEKEEALLDWLLAQEDPPTENQILEMADKLSKLPEEES